MEGSYKVPAFKYTRSLTTDCLRGVNNDYPLRLSIQSGVSQDGHDRLPLIKSDIACHNINEYLQEPSCFSATDFRDFLRFASF